jgi:L-galactose dehydrogenase/L-glyceraldehyde 3-phosphate reductase
MERVDLFQLHNLVRAQRREGAVAVADLLDEIVPTLQDLRRAGKIRFYGITALGETPALHRALEAGVLDTAQLCLSLLNPTAAVAVPPGFPAEDFDRLLDRTRAQSVGVIVIRVLAAGALSGTGARHPVAAPAVDPIASGPDYAADVARARTLRPLVDEGHAGSLVEAALRFPLAFEAVSTVLLGYSSVEHLELAAAAVAKGPLPPAARERLGSAWRTLAAR